jgi:hypothetical protein
MIDDSFDDHTKKYYEVIEKISGLDFIAPGEFYNHFYIKDHKLKFQVYFLIEGGAKIKYLRHIDELDIEFLYKPVTFEEFFDLCPEDIKEKIIWNIDIFGV